MDDYNSGRPMTAPILRKRTNSALSDEAHIRPVGPEINDGWYFAKRGVDTSCKQEYHVGFSNFNEEIEIPGLETIKTEYRL